MADLSELQKYSMETTEQGLLMKVSDHTDIFGVTAL